MPPSNEEAACEVGGACGSGGACPPVTGGGGGRSPGQGAARGVIVCGGR